MIYYVKFDPISKSIVDYSSIYDENIHIFYLKIDLSNNYGDELAYIHHNFKQGGKSYRPTSLSISVNEIQGILLEKIRQDKLDYLIK